jgi:hypothetical protein
MMDSVRDRDVSNRGEKFTDWESLQRLASELIYPRIRISLGEEADKAAGDVKTSSFFPWLHSPA